ncbi:hypothetical protein FIBSPDRAFT_938967 [Athelia psychrophila]|uniref:Uncharacterized protein n=1 Tax=Athelia psychrophila TaxID=1759441 RepID=A0A165XF25_9AGAM|nr:hypothetical protein FIBSPDRAFT_938967 [Fibularhizoctonia sp. CBS 109695]
MGRWMGLAGKRGCLMGDKLINGYGEFEMSEVGKLSWTPPRRAHVYLSPPLLHTHPPLKSQSIWCTSDRRASIAGHRQLYTNLVVCIPAPAQHTASAPCHANVPLPPSAHRSPAPPVVRFCLHARVYLPFGVDWIYTRGEELKKGLSRTGDRSEDPALPPGPASRLRTTGARDAASRAWKSNVFEVMKGIRRMEGMFAVLFGSQCGPQSHSPLRHCTHITQLEALDALMTRLTRATRADAYCSCFTVAPQPLGHPVALPSVVVPRIQDKALSLVPAANIDGMEIDYMKVRATSW